MVPANLVQLKPRQKTTRKVVKAKPVSSRMLRRVRLQHWSAVLLGVVAAAMTTVSLSHIAGGVEHITHGAVPEWQAWGVAIGLDINYVSMEMAGVRPAPSHAPGRPPPPSPVPGPPRIGVPVER